MLELDSYAKTPTCDLVLITDNRMLNLDSTRSSDKINYLIKDESFASRHIGPDRDEVDKMLKKLGFSTLEDLIKQTVPSTIRLDRSLNVPTASSENKAVDQLKQIAAKNKIFRSYIGMGYYDCITPPVIARNILENPDWYTAYTPYQAEIAQGRLEALLNFQTAIVELTGLQIANASLLDEGTAAAEAMSMSYGLC